jgi:hypothetical protein
MAVSSILQSLGLIMEGRMSAALRAIQRHPIVTFFVLTYVITWGLCRSGCSGRLGRSSPL